MDTINMTISLPPHHTDRFRESLAEFPVTQKHTSVDNWHRCLDELRFISLALPRACGLLSQIKEALRHVKGKRVTLTHGVYEALASFQWLAEDMALRPT